MDSPVTDWLLEETDPALRYLALRDLTGAPGNELASAREKAHRSGPIRHILDEMHPEGYWVRPGHGYSPKYKGTVWSLISLAQLGASVEEDERISKAVVYLLGHALAAGGQFGYNGQPGGTIDCLQGNLLAALLDLGCGDRRLEDAFEWMARTVTGEGLAPAEETEAALRYYHFKRGPGFICAINGNKSCAWGGLKVMLAFSRLPEERRNGLIKRAIEAGTEFFLGIDPATAAYPTRTGGRPDRRWFRFHFPVFYAADVLQTAEVLTALGCGSDRRLDNTFDFIRSKRDEAGRWPLEYDYYRTRAWVDFGAKGRPNKWVTLRALRVLKRAGREII